MWRVQKIKLEYTLFLGYVKGILMFITYIPFHDYNLLPFHISFVQLQ